MRRGDEDETPDEGEMSGDTQIEDGDVSIDDEDEDSIESIERRAQRVRLMTIHGAKGLEAPFVILLDANNTASPHFSHGVLLDWNPEQAGPSHLSMFTKLSLGKGREDLREQEKDISLKENWNLLYVAITRAKQGFWMSGVESSKNRNDEGVIKDSWYARARSAELKLFEELDGAKLANTSASNSVTNKNISLSHQFECKDLILSWQGEKPIEEIKTSVDLEQQKILNEGVWFHGVLQRITPQQYRPAAQSLPTAQAIASAFMITLADAELALQRALMVYQSPQLQAYFDPKQYEEAWNELDLVTVDGRSMRIDRLVEFGNSLVILDYKLTIPKPDEEQYIKYTEQLTGYRSELQRIYPHKPIEAVLIDAEGRSLPLTD
jgi:ATP-dependent helicase/nuclease subunit A